VFAKDKHARASQRFDAPDQPDIHSGHSTHLMRQTILAIQHIVVQVKIQLLMY